MSVIDDLLLSVRSDAPNTPIEVPVGLCWTAVRSRGMGLATTSNETPCCFAKNVNGIGCLHQRSAYELAALLRSAQPLEASIGMAALNSLIAVDEQDGVALNARDLLLERGCDKNVALEEIAVSIIADIIATVHKNE